jgi:hypothetical protein
MFTKHSTPTALWSRAKVSNDIEAKLSQDIQEAQDVCEHAWDKVMKHDSDYSPRVDGRGRGGQVIEKFHCSVCSADRPITGMPWQVCRKCGGKMKNDRIEQAGMDRAHVHKCVDCDHEYDTT